MVTVQEIHDEAGYLAAYEAYVDALYRFALVRVRNKEKAKDLVQDTFIRTWDYLRAARDEQGEEIAGHEHPSGSVKIDNVRAFLYRVLTNLIINDVRRKKAVSLEELEEVAYFDPPDTTTRDSRLDFLDGERAFEKLNELDPKYVEVVRLRFIGELGPKEIGEILGEHENTISVRLGRALKHLRALLEESKQNPKTQSTK